ncbi:hypothetical protein [Idiomarina abyssalis]|uniref:hypothetical protein n=1 Tax=Idiomarina abyssalis TaxID=86102 RepID=UPI0006C8C589|nr:hypothetical protein [Idiomarina abyssalis]KPD20685.1 hypothetical protein ADS78_10655 [Idiomarina abyssalis]SFT57531.1 hypothetical protein SAMN04515657_1154 [Idiomarina abyssalis]
MIKRSWFFARRLKGTARNNSDLDLGVEVEWVPGKMFGVCEDALLLWRSVSAHFENQMREVSPWPIELQNYVNEQ